MKNLIRIIPSATSDALEVVDLVVGALPLLLGGELLDPLDEHAPVPRAVVDGHPAPARQRGPEAPAASGGASRRRSAPRTARRARDAGRARDEALDRAALAARVPALEDHAAPAARCRGRRSARRGASRRASRRFCAASRRSLLLRRRAGARGRGRRGVPYPRFVSRDDGYVFQCAGFNELKACPVARQGPAGCTWEGRPTWHQLPRVSTRRRSRTSATCARSSRPASSAPRSSGTTSSCTGQPPLLSSATCSSRAPVR